MKMSNEKNDLLLWTSSLVPTAKCQVQAQVQGQESWFGLDICFGFLVG